MHVGAFSSGDVTRCPARTAVARAPPPLPAAEADELAADLLVVVEGPQGSAAAIIATCEAELARASSPDRAARLNHEIARTQEVVLGDMPAALRHYEAALERAPDHLASIRGARRILLELHASWTRCRSGTPSCASSRNRSSGRRCNIRRPGF